MAGTWASVLLNGVAHVPVQEKLLTRQLAAACASSGAKHLWLADDSRPPDVSRSCTSRELRAVKKYDLAWSESGSAVPEQLCQVKLARPAGQEDQEVLLFLGDVLYAALDSRSTGASAWVLAGVSRQQSTGHWSRMLSLAGSPAGPRDVAFVLEPSAASTGLARGASWIDQGGACIAPTTRSQYNKIFGAGTDAKFVGLWVRPGRVIVRLRLETRATTGGHVLLADVRGLETTGIDDLQRWWP